MINFFRKIHNPLLVLMTVFIIIAGIYLYFTYFIDGVYHHKPLTEYGIMTVDKTEYKSGEDIYANWGFCIGRDNRNPFKKTWAFVDGMVYSLPETTALSDKKTGCYNMNIFITTVPKNLQSGEYYLTGTMVYKINNVKDVVYERRTNKFKIN